MRKILGALALIAALAVVAGCGGGDDETTATVTKAEFIKAGDAVCKKGLENREAAIQKSVKKSKKELRENFESSEAVFLLKSILPTIQQTSEELSELETPDAQAEKMVADFEKAVEGAETNPKAVITGEDSSIAEFGQEATKYGFKYCGQY